MASTGLLGVNPYRGGNVAIDFTSKPTQLAIGLIQKQRAQAEATDKYFKDWEKSINPAGLSKAELDIFAKKLKEVQEYGIKNKQAITNPSKYGYDAQSTLMAGFKDLQGYIEQGKQATAERKAFKDYVNQAIKSGKRVSDNYLDVLNKAMLPVGAGYTPPDMTQVNIYDPHDDLVFSDKTWKGVNLPVSFDYEKEIVNGKKTGRVKPIETELITPEVANTYAQRARSYYRSNLGTQEQYNELAKDRDFVNQMNPVYKKYFGTDIKTPEDLTVAYGLATKQPQRKEKGGFDFPKEYYFEEGQRRADARSEKNNQQTEDPVEVYLSQARSGKTFAGVEGENIEVMNLPETILKDLGKNKRPAVIGRGLNDGEYYNIVFQKEIDKKTGKTTGIFTDKIDWSKTEKIPESQIRASTVSRALPSNAKVALIRGSGKPKSNPKGSSGINWSKK